jgi:hypothetical protein
LPIKKCKHCKNRMNKVIWGMTTSDEYSDPGEFTVIGGCVVTEPAEDWRCNNCAAKIIRSHSPASGLCIEEAPEILKVALRVFTNRLNKFSQNLSGPRSQKFSEPVSLSCSGDNSQFSVFGVHEHAYRGDFLTVNICNNVKLEIHFNGTGRVFTQWATLVGYGKFCETKTELEAREFVNLEDKIKDLTSGYSLLLRVLEEIPKHVGECSGYECDHGAEFAWSGLDSFISLLDLESARLNMSFYPKTVSSQA